MPFELNDRGQIELTDPRAMRALAHPTRLAILELLGREGQATATQCAEMIGESPSACSFHLRALAKWGFIEEAGRGPGRERAWRKRGRGISFGAGAADTPELVAASSLLRSQTLESDERRLRDYLANEEDLDDQLREAAAFVSSTIRVTAEELTGLGERFLDLIEPYVREDRASRPDGSHTVHVIFRALPKREA